MPAKTEVETIEGMMRGLYEARPRCDDPRVLWRGINSVQLYRRDRRWWVSSILWTRESEEASIPPEYLPGGAS